MCTRTNCEEIPELASNYSSDCNEEVEASESDQQMKCFLGEEFEISKVTRKRGRRKLDKRILKLRKAERHKRKWLNRSEEEKARDREKMRKYMRARLAKMTKEEKAEQNARKREKDRKRDMEMSEEEKQRLRDRKYLRRHERMASMTNEEREEWNKRRVETNRQRMKGLTEEERKRYYKEAYGHRKTPEYKSSLAHKRFLQRIRRKIASETPQERQKRLRRLKINAAGRALRKKLEVSGVSEEDIEEKVKELRKKMEAEPLPSPDQISAYQPKPKQKSKPSEEDVNLASLEPNRYTKESPEVRWRRLQRSRIKTAVKTLRKKLEAEGGVSEEDIQTKVSELTEKMKSEPLPTLDQISAYRPQPKLRKSKSPTLIKPIKSINSTRPRSFVFRRESDDVSKKLININNIKCPFCGFSLEIRESLLVFSKHVQECGSSSKTKTTQALNCPLCKKWSCPPDNLQKFMEHILMCRENHAVQNPPIPWRHSVIKCNLCKDSCYLPYPEFAHHVFRYHKHRYCCTQCPVRGRQPQNISVAHWNASHKNLSDTPHNERYTSLPVGCKVSLPYIPWWCPASECLQKFEDEASRDSHLQNCLNQIKMLKRNKNCSFCEREYFSEEELLMHRVTSHGYLEDPKKDFECEICQRIFCRKNALIMHMRSHDKFKVKKDYSGFCEHCGRKFVSRYSIAKHIATAHGIADFMCDVEGCSKGFVKLDELENHKKCVHEGLKGKCFSCQFCGKGFPNMSKVKRHEGAMHVNRGSKPFKCHLCEKTFATDAYLYYHLHYTHKIVKRKETNEEHSSEIIRVSNPSSTVAVTQNSFTAPPLACAKNGENFRKTLIYEEESCEEHSVDEENTSSFHEESTCSGFYHSKLKQTNTEDSFSQSASVPLTQGSFRILVPTSTCPEDGESPCEICTKNAKKKSVEETVPSFHGESTCADFDQSVEKVAYLVPNERMLVEFEKSPERDDTHPETSPDFEMENPESELSPAPIEAPIKARRSITDDESEKSYENKRMKMMSDYIEEVYMINYKRSLEDNKRPEENVSREEGELPIFRQIVETCMNYNYKGVSTKNQAVNEFDDDKQQKQKRNERRKRNWERKSEEEKALFREKMRLYMQARKARKKEEKKKAPHQGESDDPEAEARRQENRKRVLLRYQNKLATMTEEEKQEHYAMKRKKYRERYKKMAPEKKKMKMDRAYLYRHAKLAEMTKEERAAHSQRSKEWRKNLREKERERVLEQERKSKKKRKGTTKFQIQADRYLENQRSKHASETPEERRIRLRNLNIRVAVRKKRKELEEEEGLSKEDIECQLKELRNAMEVEPLPPLDQLSSYQPNPLLSASMKAKSAIKSKIKCPFCTSTFSVGKEVLNFSKHVEECAAFHHRTVSDLKCSLCDNWSCSSDQIENFMEHTVMCRENHTDPPIPWRHSVIKCNLCKDSCQLPFSEFALHIFRYHEHQYGCSQCPFRSRHPQTITLTHWKACHRNLKDISINERFSKATTGSKVPLPYIPWWCPASECLQQFGDEGSRDLHLPNCQYPMPEKRKEKCSFCDRRYFSDEELLMHRVTVHRYLHNRKEEFKCQTCQKCLSRKDALLTHMKTHSL